MKVTHPDSPHVTLDVRDDAAEQYLSQGWTVVSTPKPTAKKAAAQPKRSVRST